MPLSASKYTYYLDYFTSVGVSPSSDDSVYYSHSQTLSSFLHFTEKRVKKEIYCFLQIYRKRQEIESRKGTYMQLFFNLPFSERPLISDLAISIGLSESIVKEDLKYLGLRAIDYQKTVKANLLKMADSPCLKKEETKSFPYKYLNNPIVFPDTPIGNRVKELGNAFQPNTNVPNYVIHPETYRRLLQYEDLYYNKSDNEKPTVPTMANILNCSCEKVRQDLRKLGLYDDYLRLKQIRRENNKKFKQNRKSNNISPLPTEIDVIKAYFEKHSNADKVLNKSYLEISQDCLISTQHVNFYLQRLGYTISETCRNTKNKGQELRALLFADMISEMPEDSVISLRNVEIEQMLNLRMNTLYRVLKSKGLYEKFVNLRTNSSLFD